MALGGLIVRGVAVALLGLAAGLAAAQPADAPRGKSSGPVVLLPPPADGAEPGLLDLPGREYRGGDGWWALACEAQCRLQAMRLQVQPGPAGQRLRFVPAPPPGTRLLFKPLRLPALKPAAGPLPSWHPGPALRTRSGTPATMEGELALPAGGPLVLAPLRLEPEPGAIRTLVLELRQGALRQRLGEFAFGGESETPVPPEAVLHWAGDLDGDGRPDLLLNLGFGPAQKLQLMLSSLARPGQAVGEAGRFEAERQEAPR